jgi:hypothetical protein
MAYIKHYWLTEGGAWAVTENPPHSQHHPEDEYPGLDVKLWLHDSDGIDICFSQVPDTAGITTITVDDKKAVQPITVDQFNTIDGLVNDAGTYYSAEREAREAGITTTADEQKALGDAKMDEVQTEIDAL